MAYASIDTATGKEAPPELSSQRVQDIFSHIAWRYERFNAVSSFGQYRLWLAKLVRKTPATTASCILDAAGGTGDVSFALARAKRPRHILCTDIVPEMLEIARQHFEEGKACGVPVDFEVTDAQDLPYAKGSFDIVTMAYGLRNMPKREQALEEVLRVLKDGGTFVCLDFSTPQHPLWNSLYRFYLAKLIPFWGAVICKRKEDFVYLAKSIQAFPDQEELARMFEAAGFSEVTWENCLGGIACIHTGKKPAPSHNSC